MLALPKGYAVASVSFNGRRVENTTIDLEEPESTVSFVLTSRPSGLTGIVRDANQNPLPGASVALMPESFPEPFERFDETAVHVTASDAGGGYRFADLAPGRYKVVAVTGADRQRIPDSLRDGIASADAVALDFGQTASLDLVVQ